MVPLGKGCMGGGAGRGSSREAGKPGKGHAVLTSSRNVVEGAVGIPQGRSAGTSTTTFSTVTSSRAMLPIQRAWPHCQLNKTLFIRVTHPLPPWYAVGPFLRSSLWKRCRLRDDIPSSPSAGPFGRELNVTDGDDGCLALIDQGLHRSEQAWGVTVFDWFARGSRVKW